MLLEEALKDKEIMEIAQGLGFVGIVTLPENVNDHIARFVTAFPKETHPYFYTAMYGLCNHYIARMAMMEHENGRSS